MLKRILVTGASGFVGRHVLRAFRDAFASAEILGIGRRVSLEVPEGVVYETLDLIDTAAVAQRIGTFRPTEVLHLAAESSILRADRSKFETWRINFGALYNLINAIERTGEPCSFAYVSSSEVYGRAFINGCPATEQTAPQPMNAYAHSKWLGEQLLLKSTGGTCLKPIVLRPFNHIGPGQDLAFAVASFAHQIALIEAVRRPPLVEVGNLSAQRDFLDVSDVVAAYIKVLQCAEAFEGPQIFNICSGQSRSIESMLTSLRALSHVAFEIRPDAARTRQSDVPLAFGDARHIQQATGWAPKIDKMTSLARILDDARMRVAVAES
ncbi:NAD-dependent epimerase/dehydratase family protein [Methylobacterium radiotolerans]|uniref:NAD-dependent epimerase/dehydratase family protein n=1 Tax=Methylobacterium TaxID=407 RepID=UPI0005E79805|nr:NAD-dependent epimerase/dehydratase family protein [Methylobacterium radiotolerans]MBN6822374.1 NAD-dependent epimerase/dehydratase family protein [Methylobacterium organophilum]OXE37889.1 epimerase [Methylobacterium radiotolerans]GAN52437.1 NAD-dependent epimerase/dehydratase [Methylobacterium sp. ME121]